MEEKIIVKAERVTNQIFTFSFIMTYRGGTYISQVKGANEEVACIHWINQLGEDQIRGYSFKTREKMLKQLQEEKLTAIEKCSNIWLLVLKIKKKMAWIHVIKTSIE